MKLMTDNISSNFYYDSCIFLLQNKIFIVFKKRTLYVKENLIASIFDSSQKLVLPYIEMFKQGVRK